MTHRSGYQVYWNGTSFFLRQKAFDRRQLSESIERRGQSLRKSIHFHCQVWSQVIAIKTIKTKRFDLVKKQQDIFHLITRI